MVTLSEDAAQRAHAAEREIEQANAGIIALENQLKPALDERDRVAIDQSLLLRRDDIDRLHEQRIEVRAGMADLPGLKDALLREETKLTLRAADLGWSGLSVDDMIAKMPPRPTVVAVRALLSRRGQLMSEVNSTEYALTESEADVADAEQRLAAQNDIVDVTNLDTAISVVRAKGNITAQAAMASNEAEAAKTEVKRLLQSLRPAMSDVDTLSELNVPCREAVSQHRDRERELRRRLDDCREKLVQANETLNGLKMARQQAARDDQGVSVDDLARFRGTRDECWSLIRTRFIEGESISDDALRVFADSDRILPFSYESLVSDADSAADRRFDKAAATARLAELDRQIAELEGLIESAQGEKASREADSEVHHAAWLDMWVGVPFAPDTTDAMLEWVSIRAQILDASRRLDDALRTLTSIEDAKKEAISLLMGELEQLGASPPATEPKDVDVILQHASTVLQNALRNNEDKRRIEEEVRSAGADAGRKRSKCHEARAALDLWQAEWADSLASSGFARDADPDTVESQVEAIDAMRELIVRIEEIRVNRIRAIERSIELFQSDVAALVEAIAPDLVGFESEEAVLALEQRLVEADRIHQQRANQEAVIKGFEASIADYEVSRDRAALIISNMQSEAGVTTIEALRSAIEKSDRLHQLKTDRDEVLGILRAEGDGMSLPELIAECESVDLDLIVAKETTLAEELEQLQRQREDLAQRRNNARVLFEAVGSNERCSEAAADVQSAFAEMKEIVERYARVRCAASLLKWSIERYRKEKQAPLLTAAARHFATLTGQSFSGLRLEYDEADKAQLIGVRTDGSHVGVQAMSTGTADQLYFALRVAAIEDYLERGSALPFVADDLFINFDDGRARAGFEVLGTLARKTQVIFFTHHKHLADLARETLGVETNVVDLEPA